MAAPILVFDSGVGGLSVVQALRHRLPGAALAYACDNAMLPYGRREDAWLVERIQAVCQAAVAASGARALVVACNTASTLALDALREGLAVPVIGTVPAIKPAAAVSATRHIGLLATSATVSRPYTLRLIRDFAADCRVTRVAADALVGEAERLVIGESPDLAAIRRTLAPSGRRRRAASRSWIPWCWAAPISRCCAVSWWMPPPRGGLDRLGRGHRAPRGPGRDGARS